jgi:hypothetical protein
MSDDKRKTLEERMAEAAKRPLPYEGLTPPNDGISFGPDTEGEHDRYGAARSSTHREEGLISFLNAAEQRRG